MTLGKQILFLVTGILYLISTTGIVVYKTNCSCIGKEQVGIYVTPESCDTKIHQHHQHDTENNTISCCAHECHECAATEKGCGCQSPQTFFFKLINPIVNEEVLFVKVQQQELKIIFNYLYSEILFETENEIAQPVHTSPPPIRNNSFEFLIQIHQLKIPSFA